MKGATLIISFRSFVANKAERYLKGQFEVAGGKAGFAKERKQYLSRRHFRSLKISSFKGSTMFNG